MFNSLRSRVTVTLIALAMLPLLLIGTVLTERSFRAQQIEVIDTQSQIVSLVANDITHFIELRQSELSLLSNARHLLPSDTRGSSLYELLLGQNIYDELLLLDKDADVLTYLSRFGGSTQEEFEDYTINPVFSVPVETVETYYSTVFFDETTNEPTMTISLPLTDIMSGEVTGVLVANFRFRTIWNLVLEQSSAHDAIIYVLDGQNRVIAHPNPSIVLQETLFQVPDTDGVHTGLDNNEKLLVSQEIQFGNQQFTVVSEIPVAAAFAAANNIILTTVVLLVITLVVAIVVSIWSTGQIVQPIEQLAQTAETIADGNLGVRAQVPGQDEISQLAMSFNNMAVQLGELIGGLEQRVAERTRDLKIASDVSRQVSRVLDMKQLLPYLVNTTREGFDLSHVNIYLYENKTSNLHLAAGSGSVGHKMMEQGKQFNLDDKGLVPLTARTFEHQIINDVQASKDHLVNPLLPETRSETALPMRVGTRLIGVLDLQSNEVNHFSDEQLSVLTTLADQIAIAVQNAGLFAEAETARESAERSDQVKSSFLASMSHELRTPLNAVINFTKFVAKGDLGPINVEQEEMLNEVVDSARHLLNLINDVLDMSKIESGSLNLFIEENVDVQSILERVITTGKGLIGEKPIEIRANIAEELIKIRADKQRILQICLNIMSNACKFTSEGYIEVQARQEGEEVLIAIEDSGTGIALENQDLVFEAFKQTTTGLREGGGTGLGMPISKNLAEIHGGRLWLKSEEGKGTTVFVALPIKSEQLVAIIS